MDDGRKFFYQTFNSCAYDHQKYEALYTGPGASIELEAFWREKEANNIPSCKLKISPVATILQQTDQDYERGTHSFDGVPLLDSFVKGGPLAGTGTTAHGCSANRARRVLRRKEVVYARDVPELAEFICDVPSEIMGRLQLGQSGLLEIAQGFQLSYLLSDMVPYTTSRNCSVAAGLDDMMLPPRYAGNVIINFRTFPIRINSNKYICKTTGNHLTWAETQSGKYDYLTIKGNSGPGYPDQQETTWDAVTISSGSPEPLHEFTSVTKLPRRVFTFSKTNLEQAIAHNDTGHEIFLSVGFFDYVDNQMAGVRGMAAGINDHLLTAKTRSWLLDNMRPHLDRVRFIGTGPLTDDKILYTNLGL